MKETPRKWWVVGGIIFFGLVIVLVKKSSGGYSPNIPMSYPGLAGVAQDMVSLRNSEGSGVASEGLISKMIAPAPDASPQVVSGERMVIANSSLSLLVKNVSEARDQIVSYAQDVGGYMVSSDIQDPDDAGSGVVVIRVPTQSLQEAIAKVKTHAVKVISENLNGQDVTDEFIDIEERIFQLDQTKVRMETLAAQAREVSDLVSITQQILNIQQQIDGLKGQQASLSQNALLARLTIYLSTDELALPYQPDNAFRPGVVYKQAVRSLLGMLHTVATFAIWAGVYAVVWVPVVVVIFFLFFRKKRKT